MLYSMTFQSGLATLALSGVSVVTAVRRFAVTKTANHIVAAVSSAARQPPV
jgi:hypothetical protein